MHTESLSVEDCTNTTEYTNARIESKGSATTCVNRMDTHSVYVNCYNRYLNGDGPYFCCADRYECQQYSYCFNRYICTDRQYCSQYLNYINCTDKAIVHNNFNGAVDITWDRAWNNSLQNEVAVGDVVKEIRDNIKEIQETKRVGLDSISEGTFVGSGSLSTEGITDADLIKNSSQINKKNINTLIENIKNVYSTLHRGTESISLNPVSENAPLAFNDILALKTEVENLALKQLDYLNNVKCYNTVATVNYYCRNHHTDWDCPDNCIHGGCQDTLNGCANTNCQDNNNNCVHNNCVDFTDWQGGWPVYGNLAVVP